MQPGSRWCRRPRVAAALAVAICLGPVAAGAGVGLLVSLIVPAPAGVAGWIGWSIVVLGSGFVAAVLAERLVRRLGPLALLVQLSLGFPDRAPSRLAIALRASSGSRLKAYLGAAGSGPAGASLAMHAERVLTLVAALSGYDRRTRGHSERVRALTDLLAKQLVLDAGTAERLRWGALLHDIGKMSVSSEILNKPGAPDAHELRVLRGHPEEGLRLAAPLTAWLGDEIRAIGEHHERFDGTGYPFGLHADEISLAGRIVALTDAFDTMTSVRSYKRAMTPGDARREVARCAGSHFDPAISRAFLEVSLPRLWLVVGPAALLAQVPVVGLTLRGLAQTPALTSGAAGALGAALLTLGALSPGAPSPSSAPGSPPDALTPEAIGSGALPASSATPLPPAATSGQPGAPSVVPGTPPLPALPQGPLDDLATDLTGQLAQGLGTTLEDLPRLREVLERLSIPRR